jgi:hypothetical protein
MGRMNNKEAGWNNPEIKNKTWLNITAHWMAFLLHIH